MAKPSAPKRNLNKIVSDAPNEANRTELRITGEEARSVAALLR
jgi:hypothetical protein